MTETHPTQPEAPGVSTGELISDLPSPRRPVTAGVLALWLGGWAFGLVFMTRQLLVPGPFGADELFLLAWMALWAAAGVAVVGYLAWLLAGRERVRVEDGDLVIRRGVGNVGWTQRWPLGSIRGLRTFGREIPPVIALGLDVAGSGASGVRFESNGRVVRFARTLSEHDARAIVLRLRERPELAGEPHGHEPDGPRSTSAA